MLNILVVEDETAIRAMLRDFLSGHGYAIKEAADTKEADKILAGRPQDLIILDWMLPHKSGAQWLKEIRNKETTRETPVLMLTARTEEEDKIKGLETGADDYMTKPVSLRELLARVKALLRRAQGANTDDILVRGDVSINMSLNELRIHGQPVKIGLTEFRLLYYFMKTSGRIHSRTHLLDRVWGQNVFIEERTVDVHILRLRKILKSHQVGHMVQTVRGVGYRFTEKSDAG